MKPKPFIQANTNPSSCFTEKTEVWVGFATMVILSLISTQPPSLASEETLVLFVLWWAQWHFLLSKGLLLVSPPAPSTITNLVLSPYRKLEASAESYQNLSRSLCCLYTPTP